MLIVKSREPSAATVIKDGTYRAVLTGIRQFENTYGPRLGFEFTIAEGPHRGATVMRSTAPQLTAKSKLSEVIQGITGKPLSPEDLAKGFDLERLIDRPCNILVLQAASKAGAIYSNVERVYPAD